MPTIKDGYVYPMEGPGLGVDLLPAVFDRSDLTVRRSNVLRILKCSNALFDLSGRTALVTGSSRGLGRAIAEGMAKAGAALIINGVDPKRVEPRSPRFAPPDIRPRARRSTSPTRRRSSQRSSDFDTEGIDDRHSRQQCRHPAPQAAGRVHHRRMAQGDRDQPHQRLRDRPRSRQAHDPAQARQDHQYRLAGERARAPDRRALHRGQGRHQEPDPLDGGRMGRKPASRPTPSAPATCSPT